MRKPVSVQYDGKVIHLTGVIADVVVALTAARQNFVESSTTGWCLECHIGADKIDLYEREKVVSVKRER